MTLQPRSLTKLLALEQPNIMYYIEPQLLAYGGSMFIYGQPGTFKSFLAIEMMHSLATNKRWLIYDTKGPVKSLMFQAEQHETMYQERMISYTKSRISDPSSMDKYMTFVNSPNFKLDDWRGMTQLEDVIKKEQPQVLFSDCIYRVIKSANDTASIGRYLDDMTGLMTKYNLSTVHIHHTRKEGDDDRNFQEMTGWGGIAAWADTILRVTRDPANTNLSLKWEKTKNARREVSDVVVRVDQENLRFIPR